MTSRRSNTGKNNRSKARLLAVLLGSTFIAGSAAAADDAAQPAADAAAQPMMGGLETVTVTAQKQEEDLQSVPFSVSALTGKALETFQYKDLQNLNGVVPNVLFTQMSNVSLTLAPSIRGIGLTNNPDPYTGTEVAVVIDGVVQGTRLLGLSDQFDVERVEVLRGPQGTLFGADTLGGVVNIVSKMPTGRFGVYGEITKGNYDETNAAAAVNFPIIDNVLAGKVSVSQRTRDGFFTNQADGQDLMWVNSTKLRGYLLFTPTSDLTATFIAGHDRIRNGADTAQNVSLPDELFWRPGIVDRPSFSVYSDSVQPNNADLNTYTLNIDWQTPVGEVTSITNFTNFNAFNIQDVDATAEFLMNAGRVIESDQRSQELRLSTHPTENTNLLAGLFYMDTHSDIDTISVLPTLSPGTITSQRVLTDQRSIALFVQGYWNVTDALRLGGGFRMTNVQSDLESRNRTNFNPVLSPTNYSENLANSTLLDSWIADGQHSWTEPSGKVSVDYKVDQDVMLYGYYARGFKSGGFNGRITDPRDIGPYNPEFINTFEVGVRSDWLDNRLRANLSAFYNKWDNMQVPQSVFHGAVASSTILNAASATTKGIELEVDAVPTDELLISGSIGYLAAAYDSFSDSGIDYSGRPTPYAPQWTASLTASYVFHTDAFDLTPAVQYSFVGSRWAAFTQYSVEHLDSYNMVNANVDFALPDSKWKLSLWATNLFDKEYFTSSLNVPPLFSFASVGAPRQFGATVRFAFE